MSHALEVILRFFFGDAVDHENIPRLRILICILLSLACLMLIIGIMGNMAVVSSPITASDNEQFNQSAEAFLHNLKEGRIREAYSQTSHEYQKEVNEEQFIAIMKRNPFPSGKGTSSLFPSNVNDGKIRRFWYSGHLTSGSIEFSLEVIKDGDEYQINKFSLK